MIINKVMLACAGKIDSLPKELLEYGLMSPKIDGIRCHIEEVNGVNVAMSRANKPIPNRSLQKRIQHFPLGLDGELTVGEPCASDVFRKTTSALMSQDGEPDFRFNVFDEGCDEEGKDAKTAPMVSWPSAPMFQNLILKHGAIASAQTRRGIAILMVCFR